MSMLNINFLNEAVIDRGIKEPNEVLNYIFTNSPFYETEHRRYPVYWLE